MEKMISEWQGEFHFPNLSLHPLQREDAVLDRERACFVRRMEWDDEAREQRPRQWCLNPLLACFLNGTGCTHSQQQVIRQKVFFLLYRKFRSRLLIVELPCCLVRTGGQNCGPWWREMVICELTTSGLSHATHFMLVSVMKPCMFFWVDPRNYRSFKLLIVLI